ncbi:MAG: hypothetical protein ACRC57_08295 [Sarcina sp.]
MEYYLNTTLVMVNQTGIRYQTLAELNLNTTLVMVNHRENKIKVLAIKFKYNSCYG